VTIPINIERRHDRTCFQWIKLHPRGTPLQDGHDAICGQIFRAISIILAHQAADRAFRSAKIVHHPAQCDLGLIAEWLCDFGPEPRPGSRCTLLLLPQLTPARMRLSAR
jgi:hypothetical protein